MSGYIAFAQLNRSRFSPGSSCCIPGSLFWINHVVIPNPVYPGICSIRAQLLIRTCHKLSMEISEPHLGNLFVNAWCNVIFLAFFVFMTLCIQFVNMDKHTRRNVVRILWHIVPSFQMKCPKQIIFISAFVIAGVKILCTSHNKQKKHFERRHIFWTAVHKKKSHVWLLQ